MDNYYVKLSWFFSNSVFKAFILYSKASLSSWLLANYISTYLKDCLSSSTSLSDTLNYYRTCEPLTKLVGLTTLIYGGKWLWTVAMFAFLKIYE